MFPKSDSATVKLDPRVVAYLNLLLKLPIPKTTVFFIISNMLIALASAENPPIDESTSCSANQNPMIDIKALVDQRLVVEPGTNFNHTFCAKKITENIAKTVEIYPHSDSYISRVLHSEVKIVCTTLKKINKAVKSKDNIQGYFQTTGKMFLAPIIEGRQNQSAMVTINHEFMHADAYFLHSKDPCYRKNPLNPSNAVVPVHPYSLKNIQEYHKAFDLGDDRLEKFGTLRARKEYSKKEYSKKKLIKEKFTAKENKLLERYMAAAASCPFYVNTDNSITVSVLTSSEHQMLIRTLDKDLKVGDTCFYPTGQKVEVVFISLENNQFILKLKPLDVASKLINIPDRIKALTKYENPDVKIAEREAYTFQDLSETAIKTFYPEAYELRQMYISRCVPIEDRDNLHRPG